MSSQNDSGVPVVHAPDGVGYRLIELPPELLEALESPNPPNLSLEASAASAVLKCGSQEWALRQKNTSNALILLKPDDINASTASSPGRAGLKLISTTHDTIELVPESADKPAVPLSRGKWHEKFARGR
ncbi:hypothetical protein F4808DRAFT_430188 [Astrocystis sublimbata]|nr:hypothetical protein F4808DRAFT_359194 [Astrocystis sublimbata]KAI0193134.1 hypothetical protein F4808DRAFT_442254 [Astrocystis sublimbata]KAI0200001.1 hypothetical protein F4808DRAFT_430188 [Astrocystis sublimbata]